MPSPGARSARSLVHASTLSPLRAILHTEQDTAATVLRLTLGLVMFPHGAQKLLGWFGGPGFSEAMSGLTQGAGLPSIVALIVILAESVGAVALLAGLFSRVAALLVGTVMIGAIFVAHLPYGFFMNWFGNQAGEGFEYHLLAIGLAIAIVIRGSGSFSLDRLLSRRVNDDSR